MKRMGLRERQAQQVRELVLDTLIELLETGTPEDISMEQIAELAGISKRTLYRYWPSRDLLFAAAGEQVMEQLEIDQEVKNAEDLASYFAETARKWEGHLGLVRALVRSSVGQAVRAGPRLRNEASMRSALNELTQGIPPDEVKRITALIVFLCGSASWVRLADEMELTPQEAIQALSWAIEVLIEDIRSRNGSNAGPGVMETDDTGAGDADR